MNKKPSNKEILDYFNKKVRRRTFIDVIQFFIGFFFWGCITLTLIWFFLRFFGVCVFSFCF